MESTYTGHRALRRDGQDHFAEVTIRAWPSQTPTDVTLSAEVIEAIRSVFGEDFEYQRHNVWAAVAAQIDTANVAGEMPYVWAMSFHAEVVRMRVSGNAGREVSGALLSMAGMNAIGGYLEAWELSQEAEADKTPDAG
jgi:hypothetical protein